MTELAALQCIEHATGSGMCGDFRGELARGEARAGDELGAWSMAALTF